MGNVILTSVTSTLAFLRLVLRMLGRGTDTCKASAKASESISSWGETPDTGSEGRERALNPVEFERRGDPDPGRTINGGYVCSLKDLLEPSYKLGDLQGKKMCQYQKKSAMVIGMKTAMSGLSVKFCHCRMLRTMKHKVWEASFMKLFQD